METQTRYDLNAAIGHWQSELAAQPNLTEEVRRELEAHLRDAIAGFQQRGLNDEESFWLACKRVGQPPHLGEEFVKADPAAVWRERVFWMAFGIIVFWQITLVISDVASIAVNSLTPNLYGFYQKGGFWPINVALLFIGITLNRGSIPKSFRLTWLFTNRLHLLILVAILPLITALAQMELIRVDLLRDGHYPSAFHRTNSFHNFGHLWLGYFEYTIAPLIFLFLFFPKRHRNTPKRA